MELTWPTMISHGHGLAAIGIASSARKSDIGRGSSTQREQGALQGHSGRPDDNDDCTKFPTLHQCNDQNRRIAVKSAKMCVVVGDDGDNGSSYRSSGEQRQILAIGYITG